MLRVLLLLALATGLLGCGGTGTSDPLADQADRVADLLAQDRACEAAEALRTLQRQADSATDATVRDAVTTFALAADQRVRCEPAPSPPGTEDEQDEGGPDDRDKTPPGKAKGHDKDREHDDDHGEDEGKDRDDD